MQEELERKSISVTVQATKLTGRVMKAAIAAALRKIEKERNTPKVGRNSMRRLTAQTPDAHKIEVEERIRSFERYAKKYRVHYHVEKDVSVSPPKWTVYFKANQADARLSLHAQFGKAEKFRLEPAVPGLLRGILASEQEHRHNFIPGVFEKHLDKMIAAEKRSVTHFLKEAAANAPRPAPNKKTKEQPQR